jgi:hypothetical protein
LLTGFQIGGGESEGLLGGCLAQRHAALREVMAAGHVLFRACRSYAQHFSCR